MAVNTKCEKVSNFRSFIHKSSLSNSFIETSEFYVIAIQRYLRDPKHDSQTGGHAGEALDVIQITVADNNHKVKVLLHSDLNKLVQRQVLQVGSTIVITKCMLHYDETDLSGSSIIIIQEVRVTGLKKVTEHELKALSWSPDCSVHERENVPLSSSRGYFISLWSSMELLTAAGSTENVAQGLGDTREQDLYCVRDLAKKWNSIRGTNPAVLVRVIVKSRMIHYAKPNKSDKWPFQAHILVADASGACTAVFWNEMCPKFYHRITEGTLLLLKKFNVKKGFQITPRFRPALWDQEFYDIDINLNSHHPTSEVRIIDPGTLSDNILVPPLHYKFLSRQQVGTLPDSVICDIAGLVTYISRFERESMINKYGCDSGGFWVRRWIHLQDGTSRKPFIVQLYRLAESMKDLNIRPGVVLMVTNVRVMLRLDPQHPSHLQRHVYLSSTAESQVSILDQNSTARVRELPEVKAVLDWSESDDAKTAVEDSFVGGYFNYPPLPTGIAEIRSTMKDFGVISSEDWDKVLTGFSYREGRQLLVQAVMVLVKLKNLNAIDILDSGSPNKKSPSKKGNVMDKELILDTDVYQSDHRIPSLGKGTLEDDTLPVKYSDGQWENIRKQLDFPASELDGNQYINTSHTDLESRPVPYFLVQWLGLNTRIILQTILLCPHQLQPDTQFLHLLSGSSIPHPSLVSRTEYRISDRDLRTVIDSGRKCADKRFLLVLDCYQGDSENIEIILNRAVPVSEIT